MASILDIIAQIAGGAAQSGSTILQQKFLQRQRLEEDAARRREQLNNTLRAIATQRGMGQTLLNPDEVDAGADPSTREATLDEIRSRFALQGNTDRQRESEAFEIEKEKVKSGILNNESLQRSRDAGIKQGDRSLDIREEGNEIDREALRLREKELNARLKAVQGNKEFTALQKIQMQQALELADKAGMTPEEIAEFIEPETNFVFASGLRRAALQRLEQGEVGRIDEVLDAEIADGVTNASQMAAEAAEEIQQVNAEREDDGRGPLQERERLLVVSRLIDNFIAENQLDKEFSLTPADKRRMALRILQEMEQPQAPQEPGILDAIFNAFGSLRENPERNLDFSRLFRGGQ